MRIKNDVLHSLFIKLISSMVLWRREILHGRWNEIKCISLSFDCDYREDIEACSSLLEMLQSKDILASFAISGRLAIDFPETIEEIIKNGHEVLNHTFSHPSNFRKLSYTHIKQEVKGFQDLIVRKHNYLPRGFRSPHGLRRRKIELLRVLKEENMYDSSLIGYGVLNLDGVFEIPITPCPEHPLMAFDTYHHFRFPLFSSSEIKVLKLWTKLIQGCNFINVFLDPIDLVSESRLYLLKEIIKKARENGFIFQQMVKIYEDFHKEAYNE